MDEQPPPLDLIRLLLNRLERISADSYWAHRASGVRGALMNILDETETDNSNSSKGNTLIRLGFQILEQAAAEYQQTTRFKG